jgi:3'-phosphoadenosine 5'-phosphosulfate sulfotransferase (PAPS reductase)/FAD synthetase
MTNPPQADSQPRPVRHILSLSGGKDSTALAIYMKKKGTVSRMEYVFSDTEKELSETYDYLEKLEAYLGQKIVRLTHGSMTFDDLLAARRGFLPSPQMRWCTQHLKIIPFERYVGASPVISYVGLRADEAHRKGYISTKPNIKTVFPFIDAGLKKQDIADLLNESGLGFPDYYKWRSRSGCFFCFYQQRIEWVGLLENHPDLFRQAMEYEKIDDETGERYTWVQGESLEELSRPERIAEIKAMAEAKAKLPPKPAQNSPLAEVFSETGSNDTACMICHL